MQNLLNNNQNYTASILLTKKFASNIFDARYHPSWLLTDAIDYRMEFDKILGKDVECFLVPLHHISRTLSNGLRTSQIRPNNRQPSEIIKLKNQMIAMGQEQSIAVSFYPFEGVVELKTGNGRYLGIKDLEQTELLKNQATSTGIVEVPHGYIWVKFLQFNSDVDIFRKYQIPADVTHAAGENLTKNAIISTIQKLISFGQLAPNFFQLPVGVQKTLIENELKSYNGVWSTPSKARSIANFITKGNKNSQNGIDTYTKSRILESLKNNILCLSKQFDAKSLLDATKTFDTNERGGFILELIDLNGNPVRACVYSTELGIGSGPYYQGAHGTKNIKKEADYAIVMMTFGTFHVPSNSSTDDEFEKQINKAISELDKWNKSLGVDRNGRQIKSIDCAIFPNQVVSQMNSKPIYKVAYL